MTIPTISLDPRKPAIPAGFATRCDVLVRIRAPDQPPGATPTRSSLHLAIVIDRSGSMAGKPLDEARRAAAFLIDGLASGDQAALIAYDNEVQTLVSLRDAADRHAFHRGIGQILQGGSTNLHGGWFAGAEALAPATSPGSLSRVILLSDGCANAGLVDPQAIRRQCGELAAAGVTTSTYGLGQNFNEDLMIGMARAGQGNNYYGQTAADLMDPFREEFALLNATCARRVELILSTAHGVTASVLNGYRRAPNGYWQLPDLAYGGEAWALVRLDIPAQAEGCTPGQLLTASIRAIDMNGAALAGERVWLHLPVVGAGEYAALADNDIVARRATELDAARLLNEARDAARARRWDEVTRLLNDMRGVSAGNPWLTGIVTEMEALAARQDEHWFAKETAYSSVRMQTRLVPPAASVTMEDNFMDRPAFLRQKTVQGREQPAVPSPK